MMNWGQDDAPVQDAVKVFDSDSSSETSSSNGVAGNHVYFYGRVSDSSVLRLVQDIRKVDRRLQGERIDRDLPEEFARTPIWVHINSGGGDPFAGLAGGDQLAGFSSPLYAIVEGLAASAATFLVLPCTRRYILPSSFMLIHQLSTMAGGTYREMKDVMGGLDEVMRLIRGQYGKYTKIPADKLDSLLGRDVLLNAQRCVALGLVDEIKRF